MYEVNSCYQNGDISKALEEAAEVIRRIGEENVLHVIALAGLVVLALAPIIGAWLRSRQPAPTCGNCRYFVRHFDGTFCDRRAIWRRAIDPTCNIGEIA